VTPTFESPGAPGRDANVTLRVITAETLRPILKLKVAPAQEGFVAPNAPSIAEAHFSTRAWFRAIYADDTPVGFVMVEEPDPEAAADADEAQPFLWRLMIAADHQRRGHGRRALDLVATDVRARFGATALFTSCVPGDGSPCGFYRALGFVEKGEFDGGEIVMRLAL
jgi:diamine N-acetyltransferase